MRGQLVGSKSVNRGDLTGEGAERSGLYVLFVRLFLKLGIVALQVIPVAAQLVEARRLDEHARVGTRETGDRESTNDGGSDECVGVMKRNGDLAQRAILLAADKNNVIAFLQVQ